MNKHLNNLLRRYPQLSAISNEIEKAYGIMETAYSQQGKLLLCGNGGSGADCEHIVGELMKCFSLRRSIKRNLDPRALLSFGADMTVEGTV